MYMYMIDHNVMHIYMYMYTQKTKYTCTCTALICSSTSGTWHTLPTTEPSVLTAVAYIIMGTAE